MVLWGWGVLLVIFLVLVLVLGGIVLVLAIWLVNRRLHQIFTSQTLPFLTFFRPLPEAKIVSEPGAVEKIKGSTGYFKQGLRLKENTVIELFSFPLNFGYVYCRLIDYNEEGDACTWAIIFAEHVLKECSVQELAGIWAHELAHIEEMEERKIKKSRRIDRRHESMMDKRAEELVGLETILAGLEWMKSDLQRLRARYRWSFWLYEGLGWITRGLSRFHSDFLKNFKELDHRMALLEVDLDRRERER